MAVVYGAWFFSFSCLLFQMDVFVLLSFSAYQKTLYLDFLAKYIFITICGIYKDPQIKHIGKHSFQRRQTLPQWKSSSLPELHRIICGPLIMFFT